MDYELKVNIEIQGIVFDNIIGKIYLPKNHHHTPYLYINISKDKYHFFKKGKGSFRCKTNEIEMVSNEIWINIFQE